MPIALCRNAGITMAETVITIMVTAILVSIAIPPLALYIKDYKSNLEYLELLKIQDAMKIFANNYNRLPDDNIAAYNSYCNTPNNTWSECLALHSELSAKEISEDIWGYPRRYIMSMNQEEILGKNIDVYYASVHSYGANHDAEDTDTSGNVLDGLAVNSITEKFQSTGHTLWWANDATDPIGEFETLAAGGDDHVIKFSDLMYKLEKFHRTNDKITAIYKALDSYAAVKKDELVAARVATDKYLVFLDEELYVPPSQVITGSPDIAHYVDAATADMTTYLVPTTTIVYRVGRFNCSNSATCNSWIGSSTTVGYKCDLSGNNSSCTVAQQTSNASTNRRITNTDSTAAFKRQRLLDMVSLMRIIGLPDHYCCSDLEKEPDAVSPADFTQGRPLFYYGNPRPILGSACNPRQNKADALPAVILTTPRTTTSGLYCD